MNNNKDKEMLKAPENASVLEMIGLLKQVKLRGLCNVLPGDQLERETLVKTDISTNCKGVRRCGY